MGDTALHQTVHLFLRPELCLASSLFSCRDADVGTYLPPFPFFSLSTSLCGLLRAH